MGGILKGNFMDNNMILLILLVLVLCPNILSGFGICLGDNIIIYVVLFMLLCGGGIGAPACC